MMVQITNHSLWRFIILQSEFLLCTVHYFNTEMRVTKIAKAIFPACSDFSLFPAQRLYPVAPWTARRSCFWTKVLAMYFPEVELFKEQLYGLCELLSDAPFRVNQLCMVIQPWLSMLLAVCCITDSSETLRESWNQCTSPSG